MAKVFFDVSDDVLERSAEPLTAEEIDERKRLAKIKYPWYRQSCND